jgi:CheY-like chemotaxis protein
MILRKAKQSPSCLLPKRKKTKTPIQSIYSMESYTQKLLTSPLDDITHPVIMIIEDSDEDFYTFMRVTQNLDPLKRSLYRFLRFEDGDESLDYLFRQGDYQSLKAPLPVAILLDLNLPGTDGRDIIKKVKQTPHLQMIPIIVLSTSSSPLDIQTCYQYGANCYMLKPMGVLEMQKTVQILFEHWFQFAILPSYGQFIV